MVSCRLYWFSKAISNLVDTSFRSHVNHVLFNVKKANDSFANCAKSKQSLTCPFYLTAGFRDNPAHLPNFVKFSIGLRTVSQLFVLVT